MKMYYVLLLYALIATTWYKADITRKSCRRDALFKVVGKNVKLDATALKNVKVNSLAFCAKECLDTNTCKSFNYEQSTRMCAVFATNNATTRSMIASSGWKYYEPVPKWVSAASVQSYRPPQYGHTNPLFFSFCPISSRLPMKVRWTLVTLVRQGFGNQGRLVLKYPDYPHFLIYESMHQCKEIGEHRYGDRPYVLWNAAFASIKCV